MEHRLPVANASSIRQPPPSAEGREKQQWHRLKEEATTAGVSAALRIGGSSGEPEIHPTSTVSHCRSTTTTVEHLSAVSLSSQQRAEIACSGLGMATEDTLATFLNADDPIYFYFCRHSSHLQCRRRGERPESQKKNTGGAYYRLTN
nr:hypothetical protein Iba_chr09aCG14230 [Ipomoea batatas]